jgi:hypothetical protein
VTVRSRRARQTLSLFLGIAASCVTPTRGQSLGEAAREAKQRRAQSAKPARVYTDDDLEAMRAARPDRDSAPPPAPEAARAPAEAAPSAPTGEDETALRKREEAQWRLRFADARRKIAEAELRCWRSVVRTVFVAGLPVQQWVKEFEESEELRSAKKALADLEEEFRRTGLPPGWTRE